MKSYNYLKNFVWLVYLLLSPVCLVSTGMAQDTSVIEEDVLHLTNADFLRYSLDGYIHAKGNVQVTYGGYSVSADEFTRDPSTNLGVFQGNVRLTTKQTTVEGERLEVNIDTKRWVLYGAKSRLDPTFFEEQTSGPVFVSSAVISGSEKDFTVRSGTLTTCDLEHPHYYFSAKQIEIYPDSKIVAHGVSLVGLDKRLFSLRSLVIPFRGLRHNLLPQVGSSAEEGMFLKTSYAYLATDKQQGFLKLDLMQKRGIGTGAEHSYAFKSASGMVSIYYLGDREIGSKSITGRLQHQQKIGTLNVNLTTDYVANNYLYYPSTTTRNWQFDFTHAGAKANTALTFRGSNVSGGWKYNTTITSFRHAQQFNSSLSGELSLDMRSYKSSDMTAEDRELDSVFELRQRGDNYDLTLTASKRTDLDGDSFTEDNFYSSLDRLPELVFETDTFRSNFKPLGMPSRLLVSAGRYHEKPSAVSSDRLLLQWDMLGQTINLGAKTDLDLTAGFQQALYGKREAQYVLRLGGVLTSTHNDYAKTRVTYGYQQPKGFSPFLFDYTGKYNYIRFVTEYQDSDRLRWSLTGGYDFDQQLYPWQDLALRLVVRPNEMDSYSLSMGYDLNRGEWRTLVGRFQLSRSRDFGVDVGVRYNLEDGKIELARSRFRIPIGSRWRLDGIASWNDIVKDFDYKAFRLTRDFHCWEASLVYNEETGFRTDRTLSLELKIKAFPMVDRFGIGQYGQFVDTSMGEYYY